MKEFEEKVIYAAITMLCQENSVRNKTKHIVFKKLKISVNMLENKDI